MPFDFQVPYIVCIEVSTPLPPQTQHPLFFAKLSLNQQTVQASPFLGNTPLYIGFS